MAERLKPIGFWSYATADDEASDGHLSALRAMLAKELRLLAGRQEVRIFQDVHAIPKGTNWETEIDKALFGSNFMIPIVTPGFLASPWCCKELLHFRNRERAMGREDLIFPLIYIPYAGLDRDRPDECADPLAFDLIGKRQHLTFADLRFRDTQSGEVRERMHQLAMAIIEALRRHDKPTTPRPAVVAAPAPPRPDHAPFSVTRDLLDGPELVLIPAGRFAMGVPPEEEERETMPKERRGLSAPRRTITIPDPFWLGKYPVTRAQFADFVAATGYSAGQSAVTFEPDGNNAWTWLDRRGRGWRDPGFEQTHNHPVVCVSEQDAEAYIAWLNAETGQHYRLPSEAEWEYATRGGTTTARFWGDNRDEAPSHANVADATLLRVIGATFDPDKYFDGDTGFPFTAPVGHFPANPFHLHDTLGNVAEWMADWWSETLAGIPCDGSFKKAGDYNRRVVRGSSWFGPPWTVRSGQRGWSSAGHRSALVGFRVARTISIH